MNEALPKRVVALFLGILFVVASVLGLTVAKHKMQALTGASLDYAYFLEFTSKAFSQTLEHSLAVSPYNGGEDMFFIAGPDGYPIFRWLHTEIIKLIPTYLYSITDNLLVPFGFYVVCFYIPLLYGAYLVWSGSAKGQVLPLALVALATFPSSLLYATDILRPYYLLLPFFVCLVLAFVYRRPQFEKILWLVLVLSIREEALSFAAAVLLWELFRTRRDGAPQRSLILPWSIWALWVGATAAYYITSGYEFHPPVSVIKLGVGVAVSLFIGISVLWLLWRPGTRMGRYTPDLLLALGAAGPMLLFIFAVDPHHWGGGASLVYSRYSVTLFYVCIAVLVAYLHDHSETRFVVLAKWFLTACIVLGTLSEIVPHPSATFAYVQKWDTGTHDATLVYNAAQTLPVHTPVLLDLTTLIAFYRHDHTYSYDYLPYALTGQNAAYPENISALKTLIASGVEYAVVRNAESQPLVELIKKQGHILTLIDGNEKFSFYRIN